MTSRDGIAVLGAAALVVLSIWGGLRSCGQDRPEADLDSPSIDSASERRVVREVESPPVDLAHGEWVLPNAGTVVAHITHVDPEEPWVVAGERLRCERSIPSSHQLHAVSQADGEEHWTGLWDTSDGLQAKLKAGLWMLSVSSRVGASRPQEVEVRAGEDVEVFFEVIRGPAEVRGTVVSKRSGAPSAGWELAWWTAPVFDPIGGVVHPKDRSTATDGDGRFVIHDYPPPDLVGLHVRDHGYEGPLWIAVPATGGDLRIEVEPVGYVSIAARDEDAPSLLDRIPHNGVGLKDLQDSNVIEVSLRAAKRLDPKTSQKRWVYDLEREASVFREGALPTGSYALFLRKNPNAMLGPPIDVRVGERSIVEIDPRALSQQQRD